jgi:hypothetical protein
LTIIIFCLADNKPPTVDLPPESYDVEQEVLIKNFSRIASQSNAQYSEPIKCGGLDWYVMSLRF